MRLLIWSSIAWVMVACGSDYSGSGYEQPAPTPTPSPSPEPKGFAAIKPVIDRDCGGCHNGRVHPLKFDSEAAFRGSKAKARILNGSMPPNGPLAPADKKALLDFLNA